MYTYVCISKIMKYLPTNSIRIDAPIFCVWIIKKNEFSFFYKTTIFFQARKFRDTIYNRIMIHSNFKLASNVSEFIEIKRIENNQSFPWKKRPILFMVYSRLISSTSWEGIRRWNSNFSELFDWITHSFMLWVADNPIPCTNCRKFNV